MCSEFILVNQFGRATSLMHRYACVQCLRACVYVFCVFRLICMFVCPIQFGCLSVPLCAVPLCPIRRVHESVTFGLCRPYVCPIRLLVCLSVCSFGVLICLLIRSAYLSAHSECLSVCSFGVLICLLIRSAYLSAHSECLSVCSFGVLICLLIRSAYLSAHSECLSVCSFGVLICLLIQRRSQDFCFGGPLFHDLRRPTRFGGGGGSTRNVQIAISSVGGGGSSRNLSGSQ